MHTKLYFAKIHFLLVYSLQSYVCTLMIDEYSKQYAVGQVKEISLEKRNAVKYSTHSFS